MIDMAAGDMKRGEGLILRQCLSKTATAITKGEVLVFDTDGLGPAGADAPGPHFVSPIDVAATAGQEEFEAVKSGEIEIAKPSGTAIPAFSYVKSDGNAEVIPFVAGTDLAEEIVGYTVEGAASADLSVKVFVGGR